MFKNEIQDNDTLIKNFNLDSAFIYSEPDSQNLYYETNLLGLDNIQNGYDSFQLRVVVAYTERRKVDDSLKILVIKRNRVGSTAEIISVRNEYLRDSLFQRVYIRKMTQVPRNGWADFSEKFNSIRLFNLPFAVLAEERSIVHDPTSITVKIANKKGEYRKYRYLLPGLYKDSHWEIEDIRLFLKLVEDEFGFSP